MLALVASGFFQSVNTNGTLQYSYGKLIGGIELRGSQSVFNDILFIY